MRIDKLRIQNFRNFEDRDFSLHPQFNLIVGENGSGKTSFLEAAAVAVGSWFLGIRGHDSRGIRDIDVRMLRDFVEKRFRELPQYPVKVSAAGVISVINAYRSEESGVVEYASSPIEKQIEWSRSLEGVGGRTTQIGARAIKKMSSQLASLVMDKKPRVLPLIRYFGSGRLWQIVRNSESKTISKHKGKQPDQLQEDADELDHFFLQQKKLSEAFFGYRLSVDKRCNPDDLIRWMALERRVEIDEEQKSLSLQLVCQAIQSLMPEAKKVGYSIKLRTLVLEHIDGRYLAFEELSDGYRNIVAIAADLAIKAATLNPQLAEKALEWTPGVVLIDELDLHLHPKWQRRIIEDLRRTFPKIQFICTTHSPFLIQSLRSGEELIMLDGQPTAELANKSVSEIAQGIMGVSNPQVSLRYEAMKGSAKHYLETLDEAAMAPEEKLAEFKEHLAETVAPYADNPAFQAFLEMKRAVKLGE